MVIFLRKTKKFDLKYLDQNETNQKEDALTTRASGALQTIPLWKYLPKNIFF